jgi:micrococcal nuclease
MRRLAAALAAFTVFAATTVRGGVPEGLDHAVVTRVLDGDTLEVELHGAARRVRLIGVDTPETRDNDKLGRDVRRSGRSRAALLELGHTATEFTKDLALRREIRLELDVERRDRYGRLLAYVWLPDGRLLNAELLRAGHATLMTVPPNVRHVAWFRRLQTEARAGRRGMWAATTRQGAQRRERIEVAYPGQADALAEFGGPVSTSTNIRSVAWISRVRISVPSRPIQVVS